MSAAVRRSWLESHDGHRLRSYDFGGTGQPFLLLHGLMGRALLWSEVASWLTEHGHVVAFDQRGHGMSDQPEGPYDRAAYVADAVAVIEQLGLSRIVVIGHSMGAANGWSLAARHPNLVKALVVEDFYHNGHRRPEQARGMMQRFFESLPLPFESVQAAHSFFDGDLPVGSRMGDYFVESLVETADGWVLRFRGRDMVASRLDWMTNSYDDDLAKVDCPAVVIRGADGDRALFPRQDLMELANLLRCPLIEIEGADHHVHDRKPAEFRVAVEKFLESL